MLLSIQNVKFILKMRWFTMFVTAVCVFLIKLRLEYIMHFIELISYN